VERLWRTVNYKAMYRRGYSNPTELREGLKNDLRRVRATGRNIMLGWTDIKELRATVVG
jgi:hypothetical protein